MLNVLLVCCVARIGNQTVKRLYDSPLVTSRELVHRAATNIIGAVSPARRPPRTAPSPQSDADTAEKKNT